MDLMAQSNCADSTMAMTWHVHEGTKHLSHKVNIENRSPLFQLPKILCLEEMRRFIVIIVMSLSFVTSCLINNDQKAQLNVYGKPLAVCSVRPITGWFRDGFCRTDNQDRGLHTVCATMTNEVTKQDR